MFECFPVIIGINQCKQSIVECFLAITVQRTGIHWQYNGGMLSNHHAYATGKFHNHFQILTTVPVLTASKTSTQYTKCVSNISFSSQLLISITESFKIA